MASLQVTIAYDGDNAPRAWRRRYLEVTIERFVHLASETDEMSVLERSQSDNGVASIGHDLRVSAYHIDLPEDVVLGADDGAHNTFLTFFDRASSRADNLDLLSRRIGVRFLLESGEVIGSSNFTGVLLPKITLGGSPELARTRAVERTAGHSSSSTSSRSRPFRRKCRSRVLRSRRGHCSTCSLDSRT